MTEAVPALGSLLDGALERVVRMNNLPARAWVRRIRSRRPGITAAELVAELETEYRRGVVALGAAGGAAAAVPGLSTGVGLATAPAEVAAFLELTAVFAHAVADVHGVHVEDPEAKRLLILAVTLGGSGAEVVEQLSQGASHWGPMLVGKISRDRVKEVNKVLRRKLLTKWGTKQGALVLGRALPFLVGSAVGAAGNAVLAQGSILAARRAFGPAPATLALVDDIVDGEVVEDSDAG